MGGGGLGGAGGAAVGGGGEGGVRREAVGVGQGGAVRAWDQLLLLVGGILGILMMGEEAYGAEAGGVEAEDAGGAEAAESCAVTDVV